MIPDDRHRADWFQGRLLQDRIVLLNGEIDDERATIVSTELMALDAAGDDTITLVVDAAGGTLAGGLMIIDVIDLLGVPVHRALHRPGRRARARHRGRGAPADRHAARPVPLGRARGVALRARRRTRAPCRTAAAQVEVYVRRLAEATGRPFERVEADVDRRDWLDAEAARADGIVDEIERPRPRAAPSS